MKPTLTILLITFFLSGCDLRETKHTEIPVEIEFTESDLNYFNKLTQAELELIDSTIYSHTKKYWRKIAMVVGKSLELKNQFPELDEVKLLVRVHHLINTDRFEYQGNIKAMRFSEVKRTSDAS